MSDHRGGLPSRRRMRHDAHYVDALATRFDEPIGKLLPIELIDSNPFQPRGQIGGLSELVGSIKERGVLEPLLVRAAEGGRFQLVCGERRLRAAQAAGLTRVPCVELDLDDGEALEVALVENLQRKDLSAFDEADGLKALREQFEYTHEEISKKLGRSRSVITETLSIGAIPEPVRELCVKHGIDSRSALLQVARAGSREKMESTVLRIASEGAKRDELVRDRREEEGGKGRPRPFAFRWQAPTKSFAVQIRFKKTRVSRAEVITAVRSLLEELEAAED